jgi:dihydrofolate reductase
MRKLVYAINITLDGCCDHTKQSGSPEILEYYSRVLRGADLLVYGRKTYQLMVPYWPDIAKSQSETKAENEFARVFDSINKVVFSQSLASAEGNTRIVRTNLKDEILKLKQQPGKDILVGGVSLPSQLTQLGLIDEYLIVIGPVLVGEGRRLMEGVSLPEKVQLNLIDSQVLESGRVALRYSKQ